MNDQIPFSQTEAVRDLSAILSLIKSGRAATRPDLQRVSGLGRGLVAERVAQLMTTRLVIEGAAGVSTGGRAPRLLELNASVGLILCLFATLAEVHFAVADLKGNILSTSRDGGDFASGPHALVANAHREWNRQLKALGKRPDDVWGVGAGIPAHINSAAGTLIDSPSLPSPWIGYAFGQELSKPYDVPFWLDTDDNLLAYGELRAGTIPKDTTMLYLAADMAIGCGIVIEGKLFRGAQGASGNIGHIPGYNLSNVVCRCGRRGCIEAQYSGEALLRDTRSGIREGRSAALAGIVGEREPTLADLSSAVREGDPLAAELVSNAGLGIGQVLAATINMFNPSRVLVGGRLLDTGNLFFASLKEAAYRHCLPFVSSNLQIAAVDHDGSTGLSGAAHMAIDQIFLPEFMALWFSKSSPRKPW
ncbi:ROK family protein [Rhizobium sp. S152]|uniref:ROK family protein n=1 Tax=Rhizobium sp. S152 TaxID=3055038 RepID=UPI0025A97A0F|nr:ROK family protein [Rhizobium sp. S152]MDM9625099.1 ROK family protein [Rhizobium sp. S152]